MPMNPNFLCCIGAELKNSTQQTTRMTQVYLYRAFEDDTLSDMLSAGFFNEAVGVLRKDDLLLLYSPNETVAKWTYARVSNVDRDGVTVAQIGIDATAISVDTTGYSNLSGNNLQEILNNLDTTLTTINNAFVKKDGSSVMTGPLKFRAGSFVGAIAGGLGDGISIYKLKSDDSIDSEVASLTKENGFTPGTTNAQDIGSSSLKWKDLYVARVIASVLNNGADISVPTTAGTMALTSDIKNSTITIKAGDTTVDSFTLNQSSNKNITIPANVASWSSNMTNCITEIPQDINLTLSGGTLTLKAGSKFYKPNGSGSFSVETTTVDKTITNTTDGTYMLMIPNAGSSLYQRAIDRCVSGATRPLTTTYMAWYDTTNNVINYYASDASTPAATVSFPLAIITVSGGAISSIDHIFNGFGYIGGTAFVLPGLKGLIPSGRNADGTLKNSVSSVTAVSVTTYAGTNTVIWGFSGNHVYYQSKSGVDYNLENNTTNWGTVWLAWSRCASGKIETWSPKRVMQATDVYDIAGLAMPSNKYYDLTLGTTGTAYYAPADGYFVFNKGATATGQYFVLVNSAKGMNITAIANGALHLRGFLPVSKGDTVQVLYTADGTTNWFRFVFANSVA